MQHRQVLLLYVSDRVPEFLDGGSIYMVRPKWEHLTIMKFKESLMKYKITNLYL